MSKLRGLEFKLIWFDKVACEQVERVRVKIDREEWSWLWTSWEDQKKSEIRLIEKSEVDYKQVLKIKINREEQI